MVSKKLIIELQEILKTQYGANLSFAEVSKIGNNLVDFYDIIAKIDYKEKHDID